MRLRSTKTRMVLLCSYVLSESPLVTLLALLSVLNGI